MRTGVWILALVQAHETCGGIHKLDGLSPIVGTYGDKRDQSWKLAFDLNSLSMSLEWGAQVHTCCTHEHNTPNQTCWSYSSLSPVLGRWWQADSGSLLASQLNWTGKFQVQWETLSPHIGWRVIEEATICWLQNYMNMHAHTHGHRLLISRIIWIFQVDQKIARALNTGILNLPIAVTL